VVCRVFAKPFLAAFPHDDCVTSLARNPQHLNSLVTPYPVFSTTFKNPQQGNYSTHLLSIPAIHVGSRKGRLWNMPGAAECLKMKTRYR